MLFPKPLTENFHDKKFAYLLIEEKDHVFTITLNRPEKKNAMNPVMFREIAYALSYAHSQNHIWAVVIAAKGDIFCAGADLKSFAGQGDNAPVSTVPEPEGELVLGDAFSSLHKPCIAKVQGSVFAGGFLIICGCTHVIAVEEAKFSLPEVKRGVFPFQVMQSMLQVFPPRQVLDFCIRAGTMDSAHAYRSGLVTRVVSANNLDSEVQSFLDELFLYSPTAIRKGLQAFDELKKIPAGEAHVFLKKMLGETIQTKDAAEGLTAFIEKRKPVWTGE